MHRKYASQGLVVLSVSVDDVNDKEAVDEVKKFLRDQKATMPNYLLDEPPEVWQKKLNAEAVPCTFVFNRAGEVEQKYLEVPKEGALEKLVEGLLKKK
jgi:peroxiredoxin